MVLEAIEDHRRGWKGTVTGLGGERVPWQVRHRTHHARSAGSTTGPRGPITPADRDALIHTIGNLTLLTGRLNTKVSNSAWASKRTHLDEHDVLKMNSDLLSATGDAWDEATMARTATLTEAILEIWPVPPGHTSAFGTTEDRPKGRVTLADLIGAGILEPGATIYARKSYDRPATVLPDGHLDVDGELFDTPSGAARAITGGSVNGWPFFLLDQGGTRSLNTLYEAYIDQTSADVDEEISDGEEDDAEDT